MSASASVNDLSALIFPGGRCVLGVDGIECGFFFCSGGEEGYNSMRKPRDACDFSGGRMLFCFACSFLFVVASGVGIFE